MQVSECIRAKLSCWKGSINGPISEAIEIKSKEPGLADLGLQLRAPYAYDDFKDMGMP